ncbi:hypothetical protein QBC38DRAFT_100666 [Podospora fimiseda]|uniref:NACHT domain-containing protein n=1 Tax=Podospora fimiseda TaxID=252190 RepID=A0AAN6YT21_9PEZI|nr:hypothetical protein QBC38DRAFT_100666 [Podospora fimiseda]
MDPISALGVAAAAVGFFDCAVGLVKIYQSVRDRATSATLSKIETAASDLAASRAPFLLRTKTTQGADVTEHERAVDELLEQCDAIASGLLDTIQSLKGNSMSRWKALKQAIRTKWVADELEEMHDQLTELRGQLAIRLLGVLNDKLDYSSKQQAKGFDNIVDVLAIHHQALANQLELQASEAAFASREIIEAILTLNDGSTTSVTLKGPAKNASLAKFGSDNTLSINTHRAQGNVSGGLEIGKRGEITSRVLDCLHFRQIRDRVESIPKAHAETFQWIFDHPKENLRWDSFPDWLQRGEGCYWINGKAGSGKSTLMKFVWGHPDGLTHLAKWAADGPLLTASFFFWYLGSPLQKSETGLLRSLLHDILAQQPGLIPTIMPELCQEIAKSQGAYLAEPSLPELTRWFQILASDLPQHQQARFCFFIDGLDEFAGDHFDLKNLFIKTASESKTVKFVLSSRPLTTFTEAFKSFPNLRLQDLTQKDIYKYANSTLSDRLLPTFGDDWKAFLNEIVAKSSGVFIWVSLVAKSLLSGIRDGDTVSELRVRLDELPSDLKELYQHMLDRIPPNYSQQAGEIFQIVVTNILGPNGNGLMDRLTLMELGLALRKTPFPMGKPIKQFSRQEKLRMAKETAARVQARCLGIFEVHDLESWKLKGLHAAPVDFIHRTALEFLSREGILNKLGSPAGFDPHVSLFQSCLWMARSIPVDKRPSSSQEQETWRYLGDAFIIATQAEIRGAPIRVEWIQELDRLYTERWEKSVNYWPSPEISEAIPRPSTWTLRLFRHRESTTIFCPITRLISIGTLFKSRALRELLLSHCNLDGSVSTSSNPTSFKPGMLLLATVYSLSTFCQDALEHYSPPTGHWSHLTVPTLCLKYLIRRWHRDCWEDFHVLGTEADDKLPADICATLFRAGAQPNVLLSDGLRTPWILCAASVVDQYRRFLSDPRGHSTPGYRLCELLIQVFLENGATQNAILASLGLINGKAWPLARHLKHLITQYPYPRSSAQAQTLDSIRRIQEMLKNLPKVAKETPKETPSETKPAKQRTPGKRSLSTRLRLLCCT